ncbi:hypothetical protein [Mesoplasma lactucae]|uniref:Uncharacterized protein n=1 Tax=Mesoplasma lactucae ATCC 49193 TaxID=81460 RepID=A0A291IST6_9MOLU|nr:hypothetical protein [Mesoplasma lactucae]ATG97766.1 hypothetical protein CP520_03450 [Mesoplasma lactucae ATCC 49193]ATZ20457.1 hypothetical protein MLACT_v1c06360 [Mesoplasma lactucae ATCC 49193]MCL8216629.1 hypothetical protein [Mesoplasma lactucae ATCC 49193]
MAKAKLHDITDFIYYDYKNFSYKLIGEFEDLPYYLQELLQGKIKNDKTIDMPSIDVLLQKVYPFIDSPSKEVINKIIERNRRVRELVKASIDNKKSEKLEFDQGLEKDRFVIQLAKEFVFDLNKAIYKYELTDFYAYKTFINADINHPFIGTIDVLARNKDNEWFLFLLKTSRTNYTEKYFAESFLQKTLFENNTKFKIKEAFILNPRQDRYLLEVKEISTGEKFELLN